MPRPRPFQKSASTPAEQCRHLVKEAESGSARPCYLFLGELPVTLPHIDTLSQVLLHDSSSEMNMQELSGEEAAPGRCVEFLETLSFFPGRKLLIVKDPVFLHSSSTVPSRWKSLMKAIEKDDRKRAAGILSQLMGLFKITSSELLELGAEELKNHLKWPADIASDPDSVEAFKHFMEKEGSTIMPSPISESGSTEILLDWISKKADPARSVMIIQSEGADKRGSLFKAIKKHGAVIDFAPPSSAKQARQAAAATVREMLKARGVAVEPRAVELLLDLTGENNLPAIMQEIEKLISMSGGDKGKRKITSNDVKRLVSHQREEEIFKLTGAIARKDTTAAIESLHLLLDQGAHPLAILGGINNFLNKMLAISAAAKATTGIRALKNAQYNNFRNSLLPELKEYYTNSKSSPLEGHPFALYMLCKEAGTLSLERILDFIERMPEIDLELKGGAKDERLVLELLVMELTHKEVKP